jgi:hypothetical protein
MALVRKVSPGEHLCHYPLLTGKLRVLAGLAMFDHDQKSAIVLGGIFTTALKNKVGRRKNELLGRTPAKVRID